MKQKQHIFSTFIFCSLIFGLGFTVPNYAANIIVVKGEIKSLDATITAQDLQIIIANKEHKISQQGLIDGQFYQATFLDFTRSIAEVGDTFEVVAKLKSGEIVGNISRKLTDGDIAAAVAEINMPIYPTPEIKLISPETGATAGETPIKITGLNFRAGATLKVGDNPALAVTINGESEIAALSPAGTVGKANLTITNADGRSHTLPDAYIYVNFPPQILHVDPASADVAGGKTVTVTGKDFNAAATVTFGDQPVTEPVIAAEGNTITVTAPKVEVAGGIVLTVVNPDGQLAEATFTYIVAFPWDINGNGTVDIFDLVTVASEFGQTAAGLAGDVNQDGTVNIFDLVAVASHFGETVGATAAPNAVPDQISQLKQALTQLEAARQDLPAQLLRQWLVTNGHLPAENRLLPNYPNPFNPETWIPYQLTHAADLQLSIYDINGQPVRQIELGHQQMGVYTSISQAIYWDGRNESGEVVTSGIYFYSLQAGDFTQTQKMILLK